jgi:hypothetical protein
MSLLKIVLFSFTIAILFFVMIRMWKKKVRGFTFIVLVVLYCAIPVCMNIFYPDLIFFLIFLYLMSIPILTYYFNSFYNSRSALKRIFIRFIILLPVLFESTFIVSRIFGFSITIKIDNEILISAIIGILVNIVSSIIWYCISKNK